MLIVFLTKQGRILEFDTDEYPAMYLLTLEEEQNIVKRAASFKIGQRPPVYMSHSPLTRPDLVGVGLEAAQKALGERLLANQKKVAAYVYDRYAIPQTGETASVIEMPIKGPKAP